MKARIPGNAFYWIGHAQNIANRAYPFRGMGFVYINDRRLNNPWSDQEKVWVRKILQDIEQDAVRRILEKWLREGRINQCRIIQCQISGQWNGIYTSSPAIAASCIS